MFRSLFGKRKKRRPSGADPSSMDDTIKSARVGDVVVISGFSETLEDAYFITEKINRYESPHGEWYDLIGVEGDRRVAIEWTSDDGLNIFVTEQDEPMGLASVGLTYDDLVRIDQEQSIDNHIEYEDERYSYRNSYEVLRFEDKGSQGEGFYLWEFFSADQSKMVSVIKWEGMPFEVYASEAISPDLVRVYKQ